MRIHSIVCNTKGNFERSLYDYEEVTSFDVTEYLDEVEHWLTHPHSEKNVMDLESAINYWQLKGKQLIVEDEEKHQLASKKY